jgi:hypothetical protein
VYGDAAFLPSLMEFLSAVVDDYPIINQRFSSHPVRVLHLKVWETSGRSGGAGLDPTSKYSAVAAGPFGPLAWALIDAAKRQASARNVRVVNAAIRFEYANQIFEAYGDASANEENFSEAHVALALRVALAKAAAFK